ncbi:uncharacterized protein TNCV_2892081 [Trichonephila clavipes]|nr:uncharacterized protein TNCV_2892081 [Trichonephila clavipes]
MATPGSLFTPTALGHEDNLENVEDFIEGIDNQIKLLEIPSDLSCAHLKDHLLGRARDWYEIFGSALVQNTAADFAQLKVALTKTFLFVRNRKDLESQFYASKHNRDQDPTDFIYDHLKVHKKPGLSMPEEALVEHIFVRLEPQVRDYVEVRNPKPTAQLLERNWRNSEVVNRSSNGRNNYRGNYESGRQRNKLFESRNERNRDDRRFDRGYQSENIVQSENFSRGNLRNRGSSTNFSRGNQRQGGRLNVLKVTDDQNDQSQSEKEVRRNHLYPRISIGNIFYKQVKKSRAQVITAQRATCRNVGIIELNVWIREFVKPWMFPVLEDLEYPCILGVDFISGSKIILDFDRKALAIPDSQIEKVVTTIEEGNME